LAYQWKPSVTFPLTCKSQKLTPGYTNLFFVRKRIYISTYDKNYVGNYKNVKLQKQKGGLKVAKSFKPIVILTSQFTGYYDKPTVYEKNVKLSP
jgi:hypothetical protein